jgi:hypothetical protein
VVLFSDDQILPSSEEDRNEESHNATPVNNGPHKIVDSCA